jgi:hypothetical protein
MIRTELLNKSLKCYYYNNSSQYFGHCFVLVLNLVSGLQIKKTCFVIITDVVNRHEILKENFSETEPISVISRAGFKKEKTARSLRGLDKAETESSDFIATVATL